MPKIKTVKAAAKRFRPTGAGKVKRYRANKKHILTSKNQDRKRGLRKNTMVHHSDLNRVKRMLTI